MAAKNVPTPAGANGEVLIGDCPILLTESTVSEARELAHQKNALFRGKFEIPTPILQIYCLILQSRPRTLSDIQILRILRVIHLAPCYR